MKSTFWSDEMCLTLKAQTQRTARSKLHSHWRRLYRTLPVISQHYSLVLYRLPGQYTGIHLLIYTYIYIYIYSLVYILSALQSIFLYLSACTSSDRFLLLLVERFRVLVVVALMLANYQSVVCYVCQVSPTNSGAQNSFYVKSKMLVFGFGFGTGFGGLALGKKSRPKFLWTDL